MWPHPWDSPGKNTGVGHHFLLQYIKVKVKSLSHIWFFETPWTAAYQAPPSMGFSRQEYWSVVPLPSPSMRVYVYKYEAFSRKRCLSWDLKVKQELTSWREMDDKHSSSGYNMYKNSVRKYSAFRKLKEIHYGWKIEVRGRVAGLVKNFVFKQGTCFKQGPDLHF